MFPEFHMSKWSFKTLTFVRPGLPKRFQSFLFFRVQNKVDFKNRLKTFIPKITTGKDACEMGEIMKKAKKEAQLAKRSVKLEGLPGINIGFTSTGLEAVGFPTALTTVQRMLISDYS